MLAELHLVSDSKIPRYAAQQIHRTVVYVLHDPCHATDMREQLIMCAEIITDFRSNARTLRTCTLIRLLKHTA